MKFLLLSLPILLSACGSEPAVTTALTQDGVVRTTVYPVHYFSERLAAPEVPVELVLPPGADPIFWRPSRPALEDLQRASLIVANGAEFERWMQAANLPASRIVHSADGLSDRHLTFEEVTTHSHGPGGEHSHDGLDGHTWLDPRNAEAQAVAIADALVARFPELEDPMGSRVASLREDLRELDRRFAALTPTLEGVHLMASHRAYDYLAARYGWELTNLDLDPDGVLDGDKRRSVEAELDPARINVILWETTPNLDTRSRLADQLGVRSVVFNPVKAAPESGDYLTAMHANLDRLGQVASDE